MLQVKLKDILHYCVYVCTNILDSIQYTQYLSIQHLEKPAETTFAHNAIILQGIV